MLVVANNGIGRIQDIARRSIVFLELHRLAIRIIALEFQDVADVGAAPAVNGLVVVAHHHDVLVFRRQKLRYLVLRLIRILVFVHQQIAKTVLIGVQHIGVVFQEQVRVQKQIIEIEGVRRLQALLQLFIYASRDFRGRVSACLLREFARGKKLVFRRRYAVAYVINGPTLGV